MICSLQRCSRRIGGNPARKVISTFMASGIAFRCGLQITPTRIPPDQRREIGLASTSRPNTNAGDWRKRWCSALSHVVRPFDARSTIDILASAVTTIKPNDAMRSARNPTAAGGHRSKKAFQHLPFFEQSHRSRWSKVVNRRRVCGGSRHRRPFLSVEADHLQWSNFQVRVLKRWPAARTRWPRTPACTANRIFRFDRECGRSDRHKPAFRSRWRRSDRHRSC